MVRELVGAARRHDHGGERARRRHHVHRRRCPARLGAPAGRAGGRRGPAAAGRLRRRRAVRRRGAALAARRGEDAEPAPAGLAGRHRRRSARLAPRAGCSSPTTTPTCGSTCSGCSRPRYARRGRAPTGRRRWRPRWPSRRTSCISDVMMPGLDGMALLAALRADAAHRAGARACCCRPAPGRRPRSRAWPPGPTTTWSSRSPPASCMARVGAHLELGPGAPRGRGAVPAPWPTSRRR